MIGFTLHFQRYFQPPNQGGKTDVAFSNLVISDFVYRYYVEEWEKQRKSEMRN
jgi:hypothetical protein